MDKQTAEHIELLKARVMDCMDNMATIGSCTPDEAREVLEVVKGLLSSVKFPKEIHIPYIIASRYLFGALTWCMYGIACVDHRDQLIFNINDDLEMALTALTTLKDVVIK